MLVPPRATVTVPSAIVLSADRSAEAPPPIVSGVVVVIVRVTPTGVCPTGLVVNESVRSADKSPPPTIGAVVAIFLFVPTSVPAAAGELVMENVLSADRSPPPETGAVVLIRRVDGTPAPAEKGVEGAAREAIVWLAPLASRIE